MTVVEWALLLFSVTLVAGLSLAIYGFRAHRGLPLVGYGHGLLGVIALTVLFQRVLHGPIDLGFNSAAFLFSLTVVGGLLLALFKLRREPPALPFVLLHGTVASVAYLVLVLAFVHR